MSWSDPADNLAKQLDWCQQNKAVLLSKSSVMNKISESAQPDKLQALCLKKEERSGVFCCTFLSSEWWQSQIRQTDRPWLILPTHSSAILFLRSLSGGSSFRRPSFPLPEPSPGWQKRSGSRDVTLLSTTAVIGWCWPKGSDDIFFFTSSRIFGSLVWENLWSLEFNCWIIFFLTAKLFFSLGLGAENDSF